MVVNPGTTITYEDVNGNIRILKCIERLNGFVKWRKAAPYSAAALYTCEDGHVIQIPDDAWSLVKVIKEERTENEK